MTTFTIKLGGTKYDCPKFNLGQIREAARLSQSDTPPADVPFVILLMALQRAAPPVATEDALLAIEPEDGEWAEAIETVMVKSGLRKSKDAPAGEAKGPETAPA